MSSYVVIDFDRTAPSIEIYAPRYTTNELINVITIEADEPLSTFQEFYAIDNQNTKHDFTFHQESENTYVGIVQFNAVPTGILTFYARVKDTVDNTSNLISKTIEVKEELHLLKIDISDTARKITESNRALSTIIEETRTPLVQVEDSRNREDITVRTRLIETTDEDADLEERG